MKMKELKFEINKYTKGQMELLINYLREGVDLIEIDPTIYTVNEMELIAIGMKKNILSQDSITPGKFSDDQLKILKVAVDNNMPELLNEPATDTPEVLHNKYIWLKYQKEGNQ